jgi:hypothetical protein
VASQFVSYWYDVDLRLTKGDRAGELGAASGGAVWRPGLSVQAYVATAGALPHSRRVQPLTAVAVPATAVLYHQGQALVYVRLAPGKFERREVRLLGRQGYGWVVAPAQDLAPIGVKPGERIVSRQAQVLLSEEFRVQAAD